VLTVGSNVVGELKLVRKAKLEFRIRKESEVESGELFELVVEAILSVGQSQGE